MKTALVTGITGQDGSYLTELLLSATGETFTLRDFLDEAFKHLDMDWKKHVEIDPRYYRPTEVDVLMGNASKVKKKLNRRPKVKFAELVRIMIDADLQAESEKPSSVVTSYELLGR